ncbi:ribonuclease H-like domain-containing protein [Halobacteria archaeon AArc-m2/3/4]|uniref:Ribonuclease H-like domain-containing protein n=1 Tax=Natronoglomus mannanivorans TaxID=2979990 RepID=A0ABT2Q8D6_9EURY|nr:ribonuclease H-like domain-containing protein [Halobacteria archaeon AArc-m2/3/4]
MSNGDGSSLLALPPAVAERSIPTLEDVRDYFDPDGVWVIGPNREPKAAARARQVFDPPVVHPPLGDAGPVQRHDLGEVSVVTVQNGAVLEDAAEVLAADGRRDGTPSVLVCDDVTTTVRPTALETSLEFAPALAALATEADRESLTVLTGALPATYDRTWHLEHSSGACLGVASSGPESTSDPTDAVAVRVHGLGSVDGYGPARSISSLAISRDESSTSPNGLTIDVETLDADEFGLEAVTGVGPKTAERLEKRSITTRSELLETPLAQLCDLPNVGSTGAERMHAHAEVLETGEPRRLTGEALPGESHRPPLCLDIETDDLSPTIIWQVGVYDPVDDSYRAFVERTDPADPGPVLEAFCDWLLGTHPDRALCTWNGWRFDYRHLGAFVNGHVPHYASEWESIPKFDLYKWVTDGNALLPGRTNRLEDVSNALGYEGRETGLDGAATAAAYQRFMRTGAELEWDRHEAYCEDDCRALWHVYERVREAPRASGSGSGSVSRAGTGDRDKTEGARTSSESESESEQVGLDSF